MPTIISQQPVPNPDSAGLPSLLPSADEIALFKHANLIGWWDAEHGLEVTQLRDRKGDVKLVRVSSSMPTLQPALAAYNAKPSLLYPNASYGLNSGAQLVVPTAGAYSLIVVGRAGAGDNAFLVGTGGANPTAIQHLSTGNFAFTTNIGGTSANAGSLTTYPRVFADGPNIVIASHNPALGAGAGALALRVNRGRGEIATTGHANGGTPNGNGVLHVGGVGTPLQGSVDGGDIAAVLVCNVSLHDAANLALRNLIESVLGTKYGITAP